ALCKYYEAVAPLLLPYLHGRICPLVAAKTGRKLWPLPDWTPSWVRTAVVPRGNEEVRGAIVEDLDTLLFLLEAGCGSLLMTPVREESPAAADFVALRIAGEKAWRAALAARALVEATGLAAFAKTAGAGAYDVLVPVGDAPADGVHVLGALFVRLLAHDAALHGATVETLDAPVAPWAVALPVAPGGSAHASMPMTWDEAEDETRASSRLDHVLGHVLGHLRERMAAGAIDDPMRGMLEAKVDFGRAVAAIETMIGSSFVRDPRAR
ncbi:MAG: bifunctional non-ous end joining protein LigD, partial [Myxococcales bacterium]|nr:bifunctional non-ous end joining protein LigD [Myxococcales bacterium]